jgi:uncharacterized protein YdcH (DUF465 family)
MNPRMFECFDKPKTSFERLTEELNSIKDDIRMIKNMQVPEEAKQPILAELEQQVNEVKEKLHDYIDTL